MSELIIVGIAGPSGSGKTLLTDTIVEELGCSRVAILREDAYYKDLAGMSVPERARVNFDHPDSMDHDMLVEHLKDLRAGKGIDVPIYDYTEHTRTGRTEPISSGKSIIVVEGILIFTDPAVRDLMDIKFFVDTPLDQCFIRRLERDVIERGRVMECVIRQYLETVRPMFLQFIDPSKRYADVIVPHGGKNRIAIELIQAKMQYLLAL
jgi:uridine kinase